MNLIYLKGLRPSIRDTRSIIFTNLNNYISFSTFLYLDLYIESLPFSKSINQKIFSRVLVFNSLEINYNIIQFWPIF